MTDDATEANDGSLDPGARHAAVRDRYADLADGSSSCCAGHPCCDPSADRSPELGYTDEDFAAVDAEAYLGLGCGNPTALADLEPGETVLDLGSGGGFDCSLAAEAVGPDGRVVGVDMTPEMVETARETAERNDATIVEFRLGEIEHLPVADASVDVILSNCVVNLSPDKPQVFREAYRVLRPGGCLAISDVVSTAELPEGLRTDPASVASCVGGAAPIDDLETTVAAAGFEEVSVESTADGESFIREWDDERDPSEYLTVATIEATKPSTARRREIETTE